LTLEQKLLNFIWNMITCMILWCGTRRIM
jgi:hypothetical protein